MVWMHGEERSDREAARQEGESSGTNDRCQKDCQDCVGWPNRVSMFVYPGWVSVGLR